MMIPVRQTEDCDMLLHMVTTDMNFLVVEIEIDDITADDVDRVSYLTDVQKSKQVDLNMKIPHKLDISNELAPFKEECVEKLCVDLELFKFHLSSKGVAGRRLGALAGNETKASHWSTRPSAKFQLYRRWIELLSDYDCEIRYHPGKANVVADALSRKEMEPIRVRALVMTFHLSLHEQIRNAQSEALEKKNVEAENLGRLIKPIFKIHPDGT
nr:putative reverse transcriptase domain-containing protein [Tanacetum cinerariifolium]